MNKQSGFTLIELLIVIAIIGALSSIVIGALSSARSKAQDTKIKSNLGNMRSQAAIYYTDNGNYGTEVDNDCESGMFIDPIFTLALDGILESNGGGALTCYTSDSTGGAASDTWAVSSSLRGGGTWCVDSDGKAEEADAQVISDSAVCQ